MPHFIDSNIWLYALIAGQDPQKTARAQVLIQQTPEIVLSVQVINEVSYNLVRKAHFSEGEVRAVIADFYQHYLVIDLQQSVLRHASLLREQHHFAYWDSLIVASALAAGATTLSTEDMHTGLHIGNLVIQNPLM